MTEFYSNRLRAIAKEEGKRLGIELVPGAYACVCGPSGRFTLARLRLRAS
jgi:purine-nucleoside phosphorylase